jgi:hypothetical protein
MLAVMKNTSTIGNISFDPATQFGMGNMVQAISAADYDGDDKIDIATGGDSLNVYRNTTIGANIAFAPREKYAINKSASSSTVTGLTSSDLNGDGKPDLASFGAGVAIFKNISTTGSIAFSDRVGYPTIYTEPSHGTVADINADGKPDIVTQYGGPITAGVLRNKIAEFTRVELCPGGTTSVSASGSGSFQWQADDGSGFTNASNNTNLSGVNTPILQLNNIPSSWYGYRFRCLVNGTPQLGFQLLFKNTWTGAVNNLWSNSANWSCGIVPDENTDVIINSGNIIVDINATIRTLRVEAGGNVTVSTGYTLTVKF